MDLYIVFIIGCALMAGLAIVIGIICKKFSVARNDEEEVEYLSRYSERKRLQKDVPVFLRKRSD